MLNHNVSFYLLKWEIFQLTKLCDTLCAKSFYFLSQIAKQFWPLINVIAIIYSMLINDKVLQFIYLLYLVPVSRLRASIWGKIEKSNSYALETLFFFVERGFSFLWCSSVLEVFKNRITNDCEEVVAEKSSYPKHNLVRILQYLSVPRITKQYSMENIWDEVDLSNNIHSKSESRFLVTFLHN